jgi:hypothetical protein
MKPCALTKAVVIASLLTSFSESSVTLHDQIYVYHNLKLTWKEAGLTCDSFGGVLAKVNSFEQNQLAILAAAEGGVSDSFVWLGASFAGQEWVWNDGSSVSFSNWDDRDPTPEAWTSEGKCLSLFSSNYKEYRVRGKWTDLSCGEENGFLCEMPAPVNTVPPLPFIYTDQPLSWNDADLACGSNGGTLMPMDTFISNVKVNLATENASQSCCWIGASTFTSSLWIQTGGAADSPGLQRRILSLRLLAIATDAMLRSWCRRAASRLLRLRADAALLACIGVGRH